MEAPAWAASMAWVAMSSGVTGRCGDMDGVCIEPVMAQVMMAFDFLRMKVPIPKDDGMIAAAGRPRHAEVWEWRRKPAARHPPYSGKDATRLFAP